MGEDTSELKLPPIEQIGIVVKDLDAAVDYYPNTSGWGHFDFLELNLKDFVYRGLACNGRIRVAFSSYDPVQVELTEISEGDPPTPCFSGKRVRESSIRAVGPQTTLIGCWRDQLR